MLRQVFGQDSELSAASRRYLQGLMEHVAEGQDRGVSAAADDSAWALKNGWLPRGTTGLWVVNSIGRVTAGGGDHLLSVLSIGNATKERGVALVEAAARAALSALAGEAAARPPRPRRPADRTAPATATGGCGVLRAPDPPGAGSVPLGGLRQSRHPRS